MNKDSMKLLLFRIKKIIEGSIAVDFCTCYNETERKLIDSFETCAYRLKVKSDERTASLENIIMNNQAYYSSNFWNIEKASKYKLFGIMLGIVDRTIDDKLENGLIISNIEEELQIRRKIKAYYQNVTCLNKIQQVDIAILNHPSTRYFVQEYSSNGKDESYFTFMLSYNYGYRIGESVDLRKLFMVYDKLLSDLSIHINNNEKYVKSLQISR